MDIVITYVDGLDPLWQKDYSEFVGGNVMEKRFRDWGTLRYLMRGIAKFIPFVRKVHLVVARESQVPQWVDRSHVNVVLHSDIIPQQFLPVFNSTAIEVFLHRIPDLDEEVLYFNDDMFPVRPCRHEDFFRDGRAVIGMSRRLYVGGNDFNHHIHNSDCMARRTAGVRRSPFSMRPQHICYALLRSSCEEVFRANEAEILASVTRLRDNRNVNVYLYSDYIHHSGRSVNTRISKKHFSMATASIDKICGFLKAPTHDFVCINDVQMPDKKYRMSRKRLLEAFDSLFPEKSSYEL